MLSEWVRCKADERAVDDGCTFDLKAADRVRTFFTKFLRHSKGEWVGKPFELLDWQWKEVIAPLFGWKRANGLRRFRKAGIWVPKKNGKSALCSAISLYMLVGDMEAGAEIYSAAGDRDQAAIIFGECASMVEASKALKDRLTIVRSQKRIVHQMANSWLKALSADVPTKEGLNWHLLIFDELHSQKKRDLWDTLTYGGAARRQPLLISISTAGYDRTGIGYEQYEYAKGVIDDRIHDQSFYGFVAEALPEEDWQSPAIWQKANPSLGVTIKLDDLAESCREATQSPSKENSFRRYRLNQWTEQDVRWISIDTWDKCNGAIDMESLVGRDCYAGLDLSSTQDTTAFVMVFPDDAGGFDVVPYIWVPESAAKDTGRVNRAKFGEWVKRGFLLKTEGDAVDYDFIREHIKQLNRQYRIVSVAYDPWHATQLAIQLQGDGVRMVEFRQGYANFSEPTKKLETLLLEGKIRHGGHPVLRWMAGNVAVEMSAEGNIKPSKKKATEKIDGIVALIMALGRAIIDLDSVYDDRGILMLGEEEPARTPEPIYAGRWDDDEEDF